MYNLPKLQRSATNLRQEVVKMVTTAGSGHVAGALGMADVFSALYFYLLRHRPKDPFWDERDRLILSCGHICPILYASLELSGYFAKEKLTTLRQLGSGLAGHPVKEKLPGVEYSSGSLGQGVSFAVGLALAAKIDGKAWRTVCVTSDGEQQEGQVWEAYLLAAKYKLDNLVFILDRNNIQIDGHVDEVMPCDPLRQKYESFGLFVLEVDGHNIEDVIDVYLKAMVLHSRPTMIIAHTIPGKGVEFMQNSPLWHRKAPSTEEGEEALRQLRVLDKKALI